MQTQLNTEYAMIQSEVSETENSIKDLERSWNHLQVMYNQSNQTKFNDHKTKENNDEQSRETERERERES